MISDVRDYIKARIKETNTSGGTFKEHKDGFNNENIPRPNFDRAFHVIYSNPDNIVTDNCLVDDIVQADVKLFFKGFKNPQDAIDKGMDIAHELKLRASNPLRFSGIIKKASVISIIPDAVITNDNSIVITLIFNFRVIFTVI